VFYTIFRIATRDRRLAVEEELGGGEEGVSFGCGPELSAIDEELGGGGEGRTSGLGEVDAVGDRLTLLVGRVPGNASASVARPGRKLKLPHHPARNVEVP